MNQENSGRCCGTLRDAWNIGAPRALARPCPRPRCLSECIHDVGVCVFVRVLCSTVTCWRVGEGGASHVSWSNVSKLVQYSGAEKKKNSFDTTQAVAKHPV